MTITVRAYEDSDYEMLASWWQGWKWPPVIKDWLPPTGAICSYDDIDIFAGFLVQTNISAAIIEWVVSNPNQKEGRKECKEMLLHMLCDVAKGLGYSSVFIFAESNHLLKTCQRFSHS